LCLALSTWKGFRAGVVGFFEKVGDLVEGAVEGLGMSRTIESTSLWWEFGDERLFVGLLAGQRREWLVADLPARGDGEIRDDASQVTD
jgi:hypothetical protein